MTSTPLQVIVTVPPYAPFIEKVASHPIVSGLRLNTVMPIAEPEAAVLARLRSFGPPLFVDLKGRQLRVKEAAIPPFTAIRVSHRVSLATPAVAFLHDGLETARVVRVDGDRLILEDGPRRLVGPGESINIPDPSLRIEGTLTEGDRRWVRAAAEVGVRDYMLSFVEGPEDLEALWRLDPSAEIVCKIESRRGLAFVHEHGRAHGRLMAARGDLYVEVGRPHRILTALGDIVRADPRAICASRILSSLADGPVPSSQDLSDVAWLLSLGYRTLMLGDEVCLREESVLGALEVLSEVAKEVLS